MQSPGAVLGMTVVALGAVVVVLILVVVWLSIRFYAENAKLHRDTSVLHAQIGDTMSKMVTLTQSTNDRAFSLLERAEDSGLMSRQQLQKQIREESQVVIHDAVKQICDSVERVMSGLLSELAGHAGANGARAEAARNGPSELVAKSAALTAPEDEQAAIDYRYEGGWDIVRWQGRIGPMAQARVGEATRGILDDLGVQGARHVVLDLGALVSLSPSVAHAVAEVLDHAVELGHRMRIVSGTPERSEQLWRMLSGSGIADLCPVYDSREEALALA